MNRHFITGIFLLYSLAACNSNSTSHLINDGGGGGGGNTQISINEFKSPRPTKICGKNGWDYLRKEFYQTHCSGCHGDGGFAPYRFAQSDSDNAYNEAVRIPTSVLLSTSLASRFVSSTSHLDPQGEVYQGIEEWTRSHLNCP